MSSNGGSDNTEKIKVCQADEPSLRKTLIDRVSVYYTLLHLSHCLRDAIHVRLKA